MKIKRMQKAVLRWIRPLIPDDRRDPMNTTIKLTEEVSELIHALYVDGPNIGEEIADCLILLLDIAHLEDIDINMEFRKKMIQNELREWHSDKGCLSHED